MFCKCTPWEYTCMCIYIYIMFFVCVHEKHQVGWFFLKKQQCRDCLEYTTCWCLTQGPSACDSPNITETRCGITRRKKRQHEEIAPDMHAEMQRKSWYFCDFLHGFVISAMVQPLRSMCSL